MLPHFHASLCLVLSEARLLSVHPRVSSFRSAYVFQEAFHAEINFEQSPIFKYYDRQSPKNWNCQICNIKQENFSVTRKLNFWGEKIYFQELKKEKNTEK